MKKFIISLIIFDIVLFFCIMIAWFLLNELKSVHQDYKEDLINEQLESFK